MRPTKLVMSAFGPYADKVEVDFEKLGTKGLYLITGDTGVGKTTVFDAIVFALYGEASGENRDNDMLRSKYADSDTETYVILEFENKGKHYVVRRNPSYMRPAKRGNGETKQKSDATLTFEDEAAPITGTQDVTEKITEIIRLNKKQFDQIAMIAQGEFMKLLLVKTPERGEILRHIFATEGYKELQDKLKRKDKKLEGECYEKKRSINQSIKEVSIESESPLIIKWQNVVENKTDAGVDETLKVLQEIIDKDKDTASDTKKKIKEIDKQLEEIHRKLGKAEEFSKSIAKKENEEASLAENMAKLPALKAENDKAQELEPEKKQLERQVEKIKETLDSYEQLEDKKKSLEQKKEEQLENESARIYLIKNAIDLLEKKQHKLEKMCVEYKQKRDDYLSLNKEYGEKYTIFLNEQAGMLAKELKDDMPCPVCGSKSHPKPATLTENALTKEQLEQLKNNVENREKEASEISEQIRDEKTQITIAENLTMQKIEKVFGKISIENAKEKLEDEIKSKNLSNLGRKIDEFESQDIDKNIDNIKMDISNREFEIKEIRKNLQYDTMKEAKDNINLLSKKIDDINKQQETANEKYQECKSAIEKSEKAIDTLKDTLKDAVDVDIKQLKDKEAELTAEKDILENAERKAEVRYNQNKLAQKGIQNQYNAYKEIDERRSMVHSLSVTANGGFTAKEGKDKITLETYVQIHYFDEIIRRANIRFMTMTSGQYELKRSELEQGSQSGLDLSVIDHYNGSERSVKTLSGGESFKASLSLALGLSDEIHAKSGGIRIDTLFVDEGFGSLDEESLNQAMNALTSVTEGNRLVGIISHVDELKERIDKKIIVSKDRSNGSKIEIEI